ncbi:hypothetical protein ACLF6K_13000 [Streptomyces xanthophaeus]|uniref:helix-turn-helix transcriptional regulator n=1 Tax=Streptomyces xanthophaeus TaxID=67385 RepID=UPI00398FBF91
MTDPEAPGDTGAVVMTVALVLITALLGSSSAGQRREVVEAVNRQWVASGPQHKGGLAERVAPVGTVAGNGLDALEVALFKAHGLIESGIHAHRGTLAQGPAPSVRPPSGSTMPMGPDQRVGRLVALAQWSVGMVLPDGGDQVRSMCAAVENLGEQRRRGLAIRLLCTSGSPDGEMVHALSESGLAPSIRVATTRAREAVIVDGRVAFLPGIGSGSGTGPGHATVRIPGVVRALEALFAGAWDRAVPLADYDRLRYCARSEAASSVLAHLGAGLTDDAGAREMRVSLRTYRRHVAELMRALGASTRFEAGARAVELGLLPCYG